MVIPLQPLRMVIPLQPLQPLRMVIPLQPLQPLRLLLQLPQLHQMTQLQPPQLLQMTQPQPPLLIQMLQPQPPLTSALYAPATKEEMIAELALHPCPFLPSCYPQSLPAFCSLYDLIVLSFIGM